MKSCSSKNILADPYSLFFQALGLWRWNRTVFSVRLVARGFDRQEGEHYLSEFISSPVVNDVTIRFVLVIMLLVNMDCWVLDINGTFFLGLIHDECWPSTHPSYATSNCLCDDNKDKGILPDHGMLY